MARKRRKRRRLSSTAVAASPRRRRRHHLSTMPRRKRHRRRGLSEGLEISKAMGLSPSTAKYVDPLIDGGAGGAVAKLGIKLIPQTFLDKPEIKPYANWVKGGGLLLMALAAAGMKQPLLAAGISGAAVYKFMEAEGILNDEGEAHGGFSAGRSLRAARFVNPRVLEEAYLLSEGELLSEGYYPPYQSMYESPKSEFRF